MMMKKQIILVTTVSIFLFGGVSIFLFVQEIKSPPLQILGNIQDFQLLDTQMKEVSLKDLKGRVWIADFIFTTCSGICPVMTKHMLTLHRSFRMVDDLIMVSITVNPEYDSPMVLAQYAKSHGIDEKKWLFLSGSYDEIKDLAVKSFKIGSVEEPIFHSGQFVLVDRKARIRGYYDGTQKESIQELFHDTARLIRERE